MAWAVITGGSSGMGLEFARQLAGSGCDLCLVARDNAGLQAVSKELKQQYHIKVKTLAVDLADKKAADEVFKQIIDTSDLAYMVNNVGFGLHAPVDDALDDTIAKQCCAMDVMATNLMRFSLAAVRVMKQQGYGHIINVSSTAAWTLQGNYSAIKGYVLTYTRSLALALKGSGVTATAVCPAWMHTNFHAALGLPEPSIPEWVYVKPPEVVCEAIKAAKRGKSWIIPTRRWRLAIWFLQHGPVALRYSVTRRYMKTKNYHG